MSNVEQGCSDCTDQNVVNTGDGKGSDVIMMTGPLGDVFTKALAVYLSKTPVEGYDQVAAESQSQDAMLTAVVASDAVKRNLATVKNMVEVATSDDAGIVPTAIAYVAPAQKVNDPETVILVQNAAKACKLANREFIFVVDAFKKDAIYGDFNTVVTPSEKDNDINFYNACKGFQRATESLYGSDVHVVVGMEQLSNYLVARYKHGYKVEDIREELAVAYKPAKKKAKLKDTDYASEGIVDFLKKLFGPKKKEEKQTQPGAETVEQKIDRLKKSVEGITAGEHSVNKIHVFKSGSKSGNLVQTLDHKAKQVTAIADASLRHVEAIKFAVAETNKLVAKYDTMEDYDEDQFEAVVDEIDKITEQAKKFDMPAADLKLFGQIKPNEQNAEGEFVTLRNYSASAFDISYYNVKYHIPRGGVEKVTLTDMDVSKIKNLIQSILSNIVKMPVYYNGSSDVYYKVLEGFSKEAKALLHNEDHDYMLGSKTYDLVTDISEDVWQGDPHLSNAESLESIVDTLLNLTESLQGEDGYSEEGFKEWIGKMLGLSKPATVTQTKPAPEQSEVERLQSLKKKLQAKLDEKTGDVTISLQSGKAKSASDIKELAVWFNTTMANGKKIVDDSIEAMNAEVRPYLKLVQAIKDGEKNFDKINSEVTTAHKKAIEGLKARYKGMTLSSDMTRLSAPFDAFDLDIPKLSAKDNLIEELNDLEEGQTPFFIVDVYSWPYESKQEFTTREVSFKEAEYHSVLMSLIDAIDSAIDTLQSDDVTKLEAKIDKKTWDALCEFDEDTIMDVAKYFYKGGYLWGVRSIVKRLNAISNQLCA